MDVTHGMQNLRNMFDRADATDMDEGMVAYERYSMVMQRLSDMYGHDKDRVCAAFCSLSPNSDYWGNLRSTVSVLHGINHHIPDADIVVSTYNHNKTRALAYVRGLSSFEDKTRGPKILNFYHNILTPRSQKWVTIDGHMSAIWQGKKLTMKEALIRRRDYEIIATGVKEFAFRNYMLPQQMQAILWFVRKRVMNVKYDPQLGLFAEAGDAWNTARDVRTIKPYTKRDALKVVPKAEDNIRDLFQ